MARARNLELLHCPSDDGRMRLRAVVEDDAVARGSFCAWGFVRRCEGSTRPAPPPVSGRYRVTRRHCRGWFANAGYLHRPR
jgi:hypothetical protein